VAAVDRDFWHWCGRIMMFAVAFGATFILALWMVGHLTHLTGYIVSMYETGQATPEMKVLLGVLSVWIYLKIINTIIDVTYSVDRKWKKRRMQHEDSHTRKKARHT
jgi:hypothetical protein